PSDEPVGQRWVRSSLHHGGEGILIHPPHQGDCGRHGTEEQRVTSGELAESPGGTGLLLSIRTRESSCPQRPRRRAISRRQRSDQRVEYRLSHEICQTMRRYYCAHFRSSLTSMLIASH